MYGILFCSVTILDSSTVPYWISPVLYCTVGYCDSSVFLLQWYDCVDVTILYCIDALLYGSPTMYIYTREDRSWSNEYTTALYCRVNYTILCYTVLYRTVSCYRCRTVYFKETIGNEIKKQSQYQYTTVYVLGCTVLRVM